jgi:hypothetical protein
MAASTLSTLPAAEAAARHRPMLWKAAQPVEYASGTMCWNGALATARRQADDASAERDKAGNIMKALRHIPTEDFASDVPGILDQVIQTRVPIVVESRHGAVLIRPAAQPVAPQRRQRMRFVAEDAIAPVTTYTPAEFTASARTLPAGRDWRHVERAVKEEKVARTRRAPEPSRYLSIPTSSCVP